MEIEAIDIEMPCLNISATVQVYTDESIEVTKQLMAHLEVLHIVAEGVAWSEELRGRLLDYYDKDIEHEREAIVAQLKHDLTPILDAFTVVVDQHVAPEEQRRVAAQLRTRVPYFVGVALSLSRKSS